MRLRAGFVAAETLVAFVLFAATCILVLVGAIARTAGAPLIEAVDLAQAAFAWAAVLGADLALQRNGHIEIDVLVRLFPAWVRRGLAVLWLLLIAAFLLVLVVYGVQLTRLNVERPLGDVGISYAWVTAAVPAGAALMLWTVVLRLWRGLTGRETLSLEGRDGTVM